MVSFTILLPLVGKHAKKTQSRGTPYVTQYPMVGNLFQSQVCLRGVGCKEVGIVPMVMHNNHIPEVSCHHQFTFPDGKETLTLHANLVVPVPQRFNDLFWYG
ncbi:MAG: hypothetical protein ACOC38_02580 [Promethearchaeia archaeon]